MRERWVIGHGWTTPVGDDYLRAAMVHGPPIPAGETVAVVRDTDYQGAVEEIVWLRAVLSRIAAGHAQAPKLAGEAIDESVARIPGREQ